MEGLQLDMLKITLSSLNQKLIINKSTTFLSFVLLVCAVLFIRIHPNSVWYYFIAGFFTCRMLELIVQKTQLKYIIKDTIYRLNNLKDMQ